MTHVDGLWFTPDGMHYLVRGNIGGSRDEDGVFGGGDGYLALDGELGKSILQADEPIFSSDGAHVIHVQGPEGRTQQPMPPEVEDPDTAVRGALERS